MRQRGESAGRRAILAACCRFAGDADEPAGQPQVDPGGRTGRPGRWTASPSTRVPDGSSGPTTPKVRIIIAAGASGSSGPVRWWPVWPSAPSSSAPTRLPTTHAQRPAGRADECGPQSARVAGRSGNPLSPYRRSSVGIGRRVGLHRPMARSGSAGDRCRSRNLASGDGRARSTCRSPAHPSCRRSRRHRTGGEVAAIERSARQMNSPDQNRSPNGGGSGPSSNGADHRPPDDDLVSTISRNHGSADPAGHGWRTLHRRIRHPPRRMGRVARGTVARSSRRGRSGARRSTRSRPARSGGPAESGGRSRRAG